MSSDWIKVRTVLPTDGRLRIASRLCHVLPVTVFGALVTLWCLADSHADEKGELVGYTCDDIDAHVGVPGFCKAMPSDWLDSSGEFVKLPQYQEHNGTTGKSRAQATKRQKAHREVTQTSRSERDTSVTREEKKREEKKEKPSRKVGEVTLPCWLLALDGGDAVPADDPIFAWAADAGIPAEWIGVAWWMFEDSYAAKPKKYADWRAAFRDHCKRDFLRAWRHDARENRFVLTTAGETARREMESAR